MAPVDALELLRMCVFALIGAVVLLGAFLLLERTIAAVVQIRTRRREPVLTSLVYRVIQTVSPPLHEFRRLGARDRKLVRSILLGLAQDLRGDSSEAIATLYRELGFLSKDLRRLRSWRATVRARAAADLGLVRSPHAVSALTQALEDPAVHVRQAAVWAVGQVASPTALAGLLRLLDEPSRTVAHRAQEVLAQRGREVVDGIVAYAGSTSSRTGRLAAIELLGWLRITSASELLVVFMSDMDPEVRVKSVKAAAAIGDPRFLEIFHARLQDPSWPVRCQAAKGLSLFGSPASVPWLTTALRDEHWWVRLYAATALAEAGPAGQDALSSALSDPEVPVREMARYLRERGTMVPALP